MTLTLLDLYNTAAAQEWSMYDNDAASADEFEASLVLAINKAAAEILYSYPFNFRDRRHIIFVIPKIDCYDIPTGIIKQTSNGGYCVKLDNKYLKYLQDAPEDKYGLPDSFYIKNNQIVIYPKPVERHIMMIDYITLAIGENADGDEIYALKNDDDVLSVPEHLEELAKNAIISRTMLNSIASETDENYSAYKKQSETAYRLLIKYSKGVGQNKRLAF